MNSLNVLCRRALFFCIAGISCAQAMEGPDFSQPSFIKNVFIGSAAGTVEVVVNQPTIFIKNSLQQNENPFKAIFQSPSQLYRGLGVNLVCMIPTTAMQVSGSEKLKTVMPGEDVMTSLMRNGIAGGLSAFTCNASELIIVNQQNWKANALTTAQRLYREGGPLVATRGLTAKAMREGIFCAGFLTAYPRVKKRFEEKTGSDILATFFAAASVAPVTAAVSHPFDTISTRMQADASKKSIRGFFDAARVVYHQGGSKAFFAGITPRTVRMMVAIPLMTAVKNWLSSEK